MRTHYLELPAEARRDRFLDDLHLLMALNIYLQGHVLDLFLRKHKICREQVAHIFGCRYPYLWTLGSVVDQASSLQTGDDSSDTLQSGTNVGPLNVRTQPQVGSTMTWVPDMDDKSTAEAYAGAQSGLVQMALDAFDNFEIAPDVRKLFRPATKRPVTREELDALDALLLVADMCDSCRGMDFETDFMTRTELQLELEPLTLDTAAPTSQEVPSKYLNRFKAPRLLSPSTALRAVDVEQKPRRRLYEMVEGIQGAQYGMPGDDLVDCYLKRYRVDACDFWADTKSRSKQQMQQSTRLNVMRHENEHYEACMREGMGPTAKFLLHQRSFGFSPDDIVTAKDGTRTTTDEQLKSLARWRGGKRAAVQQCLNVFDNCENRVVGNLCRKLVVRPSARRPRQDADAVADSKMLDDPSEETPGDSGAYSKWYGWFVKERRRCAELARGTAIKESEPEAVRPKWEKWSTELVEAECRTLVQQGIQRERHDNRKTLWPLQLPQVDVTGENERSTLPQGPAWTFGHAWNRSLAPLFWDINYLPERLQCEDKPGSEKRPAARRSGRKWRPLGLRPGGTPRLHPASSRANPTAGVPARASGPAAPAPGHREAPSSSQVAPLDPRA